ncbi:MAG: hypothetical protein AB7U97_19760 [Pirellulales bacterium]
MFLLVSSAVIAGCGRGNFGTVDGIVTLDGQPLDGGAISFYPAVSGPVYYADVQPGGSYHLKTSSHDSVIPGSYIATVSHRRGRPSPGMSLREIEALEMVPIRYCNKESSDLKFDVVAGSNAINLEMTSADNSAGANR